MSLQYCPLSTQKQTHNSYRHHVNVPIHVAMELIEYLDIMLDTSQYNTERRHDTTTNYDKSHNVPLMFQIQYLV